MNSPFFKVNILKRVIRFFLWMIAGFFTLLLSLALLLLIPGIQQFTVSKVATFISSKTKMHISVGSIHLAFPKTINIGTVYVEDLQQDTLLFCDEISINTDMFPLLRKQIHINELSIDGLKGNIVKSDRDSSYNFSPIIDLFSQNDKKKGQGKKTWNIGFDDVYLKKIRAHYEDLTDSSSINLYLGHLRIGANKVHLANQIYDLNRFEISHSSFSIVVGRKKNAPSDTGNLAAIKSIPMSLHLEEIAAKDIQFSLDYLDERMELKAKLREAILHPEMLDLTNQNITIHDIHADSIDVDLQITKKETQDSTNITSIASGSYLNPTDFTFGNFGWNFLVHHAEISNTSYKMDLNSSPHHQQGIDYMHMEFTDFNITSDSIFFNQNNTGALVSSLRLREKYGPEIHNLAGRFYMDNQQILARDFELSTHVSHISGSVELAYPALQLIGKKVDQLGITSSVKGKIKLPEIRPFTSIIDSIPYLSNVDLINITNLKTSGQLGNLNLDHANVSIAKSTNMIASAKIKGLPSTNIELTCKLDTFLTTKDDIYMIIPAEQLPENIEIPGLITAKFIGKTDLKSGELKGYIQSEFGNAEILAILADEKITSNITLEDINVGSMTRNRSMGTMNSDSQVDIQLQDFSLKNIYSKTHIYSFHFNDYTYRSATLDLEWDDNAITTELQINDTSLVAHLSGTYNSLDSGNHMVISLDVEKSNLQSMNFMNDYFAVVGKLDMNMNIFSSDIFKGLVTAAQVTLEKKNSSFQIDTLSFHADINENYTNFNFQSAILDAKLTGNTKLSELKDAMIDHLDLFISLPDSILNEKNFDFKFHLDLKNTDIFTDFLIEGLKELTFEKCFIEYNDQRDYLMAEIVFPKINYNSLIFQDLNFSIDPKGESAISTLNLASFNYDTLGINNIAIRSDFEFNKAKSFISIRDLEDQLKYQLISTLTYRDSIYEFTLDPDKTVLNNNRWTVPENNYLRIVNGKLYSDLFEIRNGNQILSIDAKGTRLNFIYDHIDIDNFVYLFENDSLYHLAGGVINGSTEIKDILNKPKIKGHLEIPELFVTDEFLGVLNVEFSKEEHLEFSAKLQNDENFILAKAIIPNNDTNYSTSIVIETDISKAERFHPFFQTYLSELGGAMKGKLSFELNDKNKSLHGNIIFTDLQTTIKPSNTYLNHNGQIVIEDDVLRFDSYNITDSLENVLSIQGNIDYSDFNNPNYKLRINAREFLAINNLPNPDLSLYGKLNIGLDIDLAGPQSNLKVQSQFTLNENTYLTYVMPGQELELITDEGIVEFIDFETYEYENATSDKPEFIGDSLISLIEGIDFNASLNINPKAKFKIIVDPNSGDYTEFQINGKLTYAYNDKRRGMLTGLIELQNGMYDLSFYGLVKKRFVYDPGSTISWSGDVMEGDIKFSARHSVRTNSVGLVSNEIGNYERAIYNQRLPYDVILQINDIISAPKITFAIDLPERHRSTYPTLDTKLNILNQPNMESERNKQVFALLVGGTFIPENPDINEGSSNANFASTAARNSVNAIMTQQLNNLTGQFIQGFDVDLGVNTYEDYAKDKTQTKTQLDVKISKNLFNDRVSAEMESHIDLEGSNNQVAGESTAGMTEFAVSYKLTETGNYRIKAFRENAFDIFDGEIQNAGVAFIFVREFDSFKRKKSDKSQKELEEAK